MISDHAVCFVVRPLLGLVLVLAATPGHAAFAACPPAVAAPPSRDCPAAIVSPPGLPTRGATITVFPGIQAPCVVHLPGGTVLCAGGETAAPYGETHPHGRAIFRISGSGPDGPGGLTIVVSASTSDAPNAPELLPRLYADAIVRLPPGTVLVRLDAATGGFTRVGKAHIRADGLYKILPAGAPATLAPGPPPLPSTLPATGGSPFGVLLALAAAFVIVGLWLGRGQLPRWRGDRPRGRRSTAREHLGVALCAGGVLLAATTGLAYAYAATRPAPTGFGTLADVERYMPRIPGATGPPTRLLISRLGIDTRVLSLGIAEGQWQVPAYAAGYLAAGAWPGHGGNEVITGHEDRDGAVFRRLGDLRRGDVVQVFAGARSYRYVVTALRVVPATRVDLVRPTHGPILTLITCTPYLVDTQRLVVRARLLP